MIWRSVNFIFKLFNKIYFSNQKKSWELARNSSSTYQNIQIFKKVINCYEKIKNKNYEFYERDGLIFNVKPDELDLIQFLKKNIAQKKETIQVLDYGGSLGSRFFSNYNFIQNNNIHWNIVEQKEFVDYGQKNLQKSNLFFFNNLNDCLKLKKIDCVIFSGSLQYLKDYLEILNELKQNNIRFIFIDYLPLSKYKEHKIFVQNIPKKIVYSSYPIHIFSKNVFVNEIQKINFNIIKLKIKPTVFYGFSYHSLILENNFNLNI